MFKHGRPPPFIHSSQLEDDIRPPLLNCSRVLGLLKGYNSGDSPAIHNEVSNEIIALLAEVSLPSQVSIAQQLKEGVV